jgi:hypothetical protein
MTENHRFIDSAGNQTVGRDSMRVGWQSFFDTWPDYRNEFQELYRSENRVIIVGRSHCSDAALDGPAIWTATVENGKLAEWRVWNDTPQTRSAVGINRAKRISIDTARKSEHFQRDSGVAHSAVVKTPTQDSGRQSGGHTTDDA